jgi:hypothetical protein
MWRRLLGGCSPTTRACWRWTRATALATSGFAKAGITQTAEARRRYRELIITTPGLGECVSGVILYDETIRQARADGTPFVKVIADSGVIPGIKVDTGAGGGLWCELLGHGIVVGKSVERQSADENGRTLQGPGL